MRGSADSETVAGAEPDERIDFAGGGGLPLKLATVTYRGVRRDRAGRHPLACLLGTKAVPWENQLTRN